MYRTKNCGELGKNSVNDQVQVAGWVHRRRDHGGLIFIDLRDRSGLIQVVFNQENKDLHAQAEKLRSEFVISVTGKVIVRDKEAVNPNLPTGEIEIVVSELNILNTSKTQPLQLAEF